MGLAYMVVVGFGTIMTSVFADTPAEDVARYASLGCDEGTAGLRVELLDRTAAHIRSGGTTSLGWLEGWDRRRNALAARCDDAALSRLESLRHHFEINLRRFDREEARWIPNVDPPPAGSPPPLHD